MEPDRSRLPGGGPWRKQGKGRSSFLKKRSKRLLLFQVFVPPERAATASEKSLLVLFFRKERLPSFPRRGFA
jgi:hypothetical protein